MSNEEPIPFKLIGVPKADQVPASFGLYDCITASLLSKRIIIMNDVVAREEMEGIARYLTFLAAVGEEPIKIILNSVGGEVYAGLLVFDTVRDIVNQGVEVICEVRGLAASMAAVLLQAGSERLATKHSRIMIHEVSSWDWGKVSDMEEGVQETKKVQKMIMEILAERSKLSVEEIEKLIKKRDYWMSAQEALELGFVDEIV